MDYEAKIIHLQEELAVLSQQLSGGQAAQVKELVRLKEDNAELQQEVCVWWWWWWWGGMPKDCRTCPPMPALA